MTTQPSAPATLRLSVRTLLGLLGTVSAVAIALLVLDWGALTDAFSHFTARTLFIAAFWSLATTFILAARWALMVAAGTGTGRRGFLDALVAQVFNVITPAAVGGDAYRVLISDTGRARALGLVLTERLLGVAAYAGIYILAYWYAYGTTLSDDVFGLAAPVFALMLVGCLGAVAVAHRLARLLRQLRSPWIDRIASAANAAGAVPLARLAGAFGLSMVGAMTWLACVVVVSQAAGLDLHADTLTMIAVITEFSRLIPVSIQGIGVREATFAALSDAAGGQAAAGFVGCATAYALHFALVAATGLVARAVNRRT